MNDMFVSLLAMGFLGGVIFCLLMILGGALYANRDDKGEHNADNNSISDNSNSDG